MPGQEEDTGTLETIIEIIRNNLKDDRAVQENTDLRKDLEIDSFDVLMIMNAIDDEYSIAIEEDDFKEVSTPRDIVTLLKNKYGIDEIQR